jgi:tetratricopeptide (TPR) repeat protein
VPPERRIGRLGRHTTAVLAMAALCAADPTPTDPLAGFELALAAAESSLQKGDVAGAETRYRAALFEGWMVLGTVERLDRDAKAARAAFEQAALLAPEDRGAQQAMAGAQLQTGDAAGAVEVLSALAARDAQDVETRRLLAKALAAAGKVDQAVRTLDEAAAAARDPEALFLVAAEYAWLKRSGPAERLFARLLAERPLPQTHVLIGRTWRDAGDYDRARAHLQKALAQDPRVRRAHYYLGMVALADARVGPERLERAITELRAELKLAPADALAQDQLGVALLDTGRAAEALSAFEAAVAAEERSLHLQHLGTALLALERPQDAAAALFRALERAGEEDGPEAEQEKIHYQLGLALRKVGRTDEAATHLAEARRLAAIPRTAEPQAALALMEGSPLGELTRTQRRDVAQRVKAGLARASMNMGVMRVQARDFPAGAAFFERAAALQPDLPRVQYALGVAWFNAGRYDKALEPLARAAAEQPDSAELLVVLGQAHAEQGDDAAAVDVLTRALRLKPEVPEANATLGLIHLRQGRLPEAEAALRAELQLRPGDAAVQQNLALVLERRGQHAPEAP